ncbi:MutS domain III family protein [Aphelenchoides besseyi]|nr:MutS domain III family protein [Aphelenchoides besseyi]
MKSSKSPGRTGKSYQPSLLSFITRTPKQTENKGQPFVFTEPKKRQAQNEESADEVDFISSANTPKSSRRAPKRARIVISSDEEDENFGDSISNAQSPRTPRSTSRQPLSNRLASSTPTSVKRSTVGTPKSRKPVDMKFDSFIDSFQFDQNMADINDEDVTVTKASGKFKTTIRKILDENSSETVTFKHLTYKHLMKENIKDAEGRRPDHPDYDPRTLYVPKDFLKSESAGHKQWWKFKSQHFDTILCFKVGKFYELYHMDAVIGCEELGLTYMKGNYAHSGFPEIAYSTFSKRLIQRGYKVARIEQTETPEEREERQKQGKGTTDKVVRRELCRITNKATQTYGILDSDDKDTVGAAEPNAQFLMSICERKNVEEGPTKYSYGVCFVDCSTGQFNLCEFVDNSNFSTLRTLLANNEPSRLLHERNGLSAETLTVLTSVIGHVPFEPLKTKKEFLSSEDTLELLMHDDYLGSKPSNWPKTLQEILDDPADALPKPKPGMELCWSSLGATIWYLRDSLIDVDLVTMRQFEIYTPSTLFATNMSQLSKTERWNGRRMILDGCTFKSLHLLPETLDKSKKKVQTSEDQTDEESSKFSLFDTINRTVTPFGMRTLRRWICAPLCDSTELHDRQDAVRFLCTPEAKPLVEEFVGKMKGIPDLERLFQRIHTLGLKFRSTVGCNEQEASQKHPDARANFFSADKHNQRKVKDLCTTLDALEKLQDLFHYFTCNVQKQIDEIPKLILDCLGQEYTDMSADLTHFKEYIKDRENVLKSGQIMPDRHEDAEYNEALEFVEKCQANLETFLSNQKKKLQCSKLSFCGSGKNRLQLEVPEDVAEGLDKTYVFTSKRKGYSRFRTKELEKLIEALEEAEKQQNCLQDDFTRRVFEDFDRRKDKWSRVLINISSFDCLVSLALYASECSLEMTMPVFDFETSEPILEIQHGYHPVLAGGHGVVNANCTSYIPNDTVLGEKPILLLSGANMSGKSTIMRQTALMTIMAQLGSFVPAKYMKLSPVDRVFCRIGANDCLSAGQSTFYVELEETATILRQATQYSLVICDELGRGTSTHDGTAVASAVLSFLANTIKCRCMFSTHYHSLCSTFNNHPTVALGHMKCMVEKELDDDPSMENVTFLYILTDGPAPKSYGFFTARMAGLDSKLVRRAYDASNWVFHQEKTAAKLCRLAVCVKENRINDDELVAEINGQ